MCLIALLPWLHQIQVSSSDNSYAGPFCNPRQSHQSPPVFCSGFARPSHLQWHCERGGSGHAYQEWQFAWTKYHVFQGHTLSWAAVPGSPPMSLLPMLQESLKKHHCLPKAEFSRSISTIGRLGTHLLLHKVLGWIIQASRRYVKCKLGTRCPMALSLLRAALMVPSYCKPTLTGQCASVPWLNLPLKWKSLFWCSMFSK